MHKQVRGVSGGWIVLFCALICLVSLCWSGSLLFYGGLVEGFGFHRLLRSRRCCCRRHLMRRSCFVAAKRFRQPLDSFEIIPLHSAHKAKRYQLIGETQPPIDESELVEASVGMLELLVVGLLVSVSLSGRRESSLYLCL